MSYDLVLIGDSLVFGYGVPYNNSFAYKLSTSLNITVTNKGINGDTTISMLDRFYTDVILYNPKYIFVMGGTNDLLLGKSVTSIIENIELMILDAKKISAKTYIGIPPCIIKDLAERLFMPSDFYTYAENSLPILKNELIKLCSKHNVQYINFYDITFNNKSNIFVDGIHLNAIGNNLMYKEFCRVFS